MPRAVRRHSRQGGAGRREPARTEIVSSKAPKRSIRSGGWQRALQDDEFADRLAADQMLLEDALENGRIALSVPDPVGVDHGDGATAADVEAVGAGDVHVPLARQAQLLEPLVQELPGADRPFAAAALGLGRIAAEEDVALDLREVELVRLVTLLLQEVRIGVRRLHARLLWHLPPSPLFVSPYLKEAMRTRP